MPRIRTIVQIAAMLIIAAMLLWPPYQFIWRYRQNNTDGVVRGLLGYYWVFSPPDNPLTIARSARHTLASDGVAPPQFDHRTDSVDAELDTGRLLLQLIAIAAVTALVTSAVDRRIRTRQAQGSR